MMLLEESQSELQCECRWVLPACVSTSLLPYERGVDLRGERVVFKWGDLAEHDRQEQVDQSDGDGREVL